MFLILTFYNALNITKNIFKFAQILLWTGSRRSNEMAAENIKVNYEESQPMNYLIGRTIYE